MLRDVKESIRVGVIFVLVGVSFHGGPLLGVEFGKSIDGRFLFRYS